LNRAKYKKTGACIVVVVLCARARSVHLPTWRLRGTLVYRLLESVAMDRGHTVVSPPAFASYTASRYAHAPGQRHAPRTAAASLAARTRPDRQQRGKGGSRGVTLFSSPPRRARFLLLLFARLRAGTRGSRVPRSPLPQATSSTPPSPLLLPYILLRLFPRSRQSPRRHPLTGLARVSPGKQVAAAGWRSIRRRRSPVPPPVRPTIETEP
jgi:hypothetical protein